MSTLSTVLQQLIQEEGITVTELARLTETLQPVLHRLVKGETDNPRVDTLLPIARYFGLTIEQLVGAAPLPLTRGETQQASLSTLSRIPLRAWSELHDFPRHLSAMPERFIETMIPVSAETYALTVKDSTMTPRFTENTLLLVDPTLTPQNTDFVIVQLEGLDEPIFKQVFFDINEIQLRPLNNEFKTLCLDKGAGYRFLGVVVQSISTFKSPAL